MNDITKSLLIPWYLMHRAGKYFILLLRDAADMFHFIFLLLFWITFILLVRMAKCLDFYALSPGLDECTLVKCTFFIVKPCIFHTDGIFTGWGKNFFFSFPVELSFL